MDHILCTLYTMFCILYVLSYLPLSVPFFGYEEQIEQQSSKMKWWHVHVSPVNSIQQNFNYLTFDFVIKYLIKSTELFVYAKLKKFYRLIFPYFCSSSNKKNTLDGQGEMQIIGKPTLTAKRYKIQLNFNRDTCCVEELGTNLGKHI